MEQVLLIGDKKKYGKYLPGKRVIPVNIRDRNWRSVIKRYPNSLIVLGVNSASRLNKLQSSFPERYILLLRPNSVVISAKTPHEKVWQELNKRGYQFNQEIDASIPGWIDLIEMIDPQTPIIPLDNIDEITETVKNELPGRNVYTLDKLPIKGQSHKRKLSVSKPLSYNIYGPQTVYIFRKRGLPSLVLFGEYHLPLIEKCGTLDQVSIGDWLLNMFKHNPKKIFDFYLETEYRTFVKKPFTKLSSISSGAGIDLILRTFEQCIAPSQRKTCPITNLRFHHIDVRWKPSPILVTETGAALNNLIEQGEVVARFIHDIRDRMINLLPYVNENARELDDLLDKELSKVSPDIIFPNGETLRQRLMKERRENANPYKLEQDIKDFVSVVESTPVEYSKELFQDMIKSTPELIQAFRTVFASLLSSPVLDIYTIARMFRTFRDAPSPQNIIFYGGLNHVRNITRIIRDLYGEIDYAYDGQPEEQCVKITYNFDQLFV